MTVNSVDRLELEILEQTGDIDAAGQVRQLTIDYINTGARICADLLGFSREALAADVCIAMGIENQ